MAKTGNHSSSRKQAAATSSQANTQYITAQQPCVHTLSLAHTIASSEHALTVLLGLKVAMSLLHLHFVAQIHQDNFFLMLLLQKLG